MEAMLFTEVSEIEALIADPRWVMEQKMDGVRVMAHITPGKPVEFIGRNGKPVKFAAAAKWFPKLVKHLPVPDYPVIVDGELMIEDGEYRVFDLVQPGREDTPYALRRIDLHTLVSENQMVRFVEIAFSEKEKRDLLARVQNGGGEGVMLKDVTATYQSRRVQTGLKFKFVKSADVVVTKWEKPDVNHGTASFGVYVDGVLTEVGACSLIGKEAVEVGDVIEVNYLYVGDGGRIYQPRMMRRRTDKAATDCTLSQFPAYSRAVM